MYIDNIFVMLSHGGSFNLSTIIGPLKRFRISSSNKVRIYFFCGKFG